MNIWLTIFRVKVTCQEQPKDLANLLPCCTNITAVAAHATLCFHEDAGFSPRITHLSDKNSHVKFSARVKLIPSNCKLYNFTKKRRVIFLLSTRWCCLCLLQDTANSPPPPMNQLAYPIIQSSKMDIFIYQSTHLIFESLLHLRAKGNVTHNSTDQNAECKD